MAQFIPVDHDPFAAPAPPAAPAGPRLVPVDNDPFAAAGGPAKPLGGPAAMLGGSSKMATGAAGIAQPSIGADVARSTGSRLVAGALDVPGALGDLGSLADTAGSAAAQGIMRLFGVSPEKRAAAHEYADTLAGNAGLPGSEDVKNAVGFEAYEPGTGFGKTYDKYVGTGIEMVPGMVATGGGSGVKKVAGDALKYAFAPAAASEVVGDVTKGTALEPWARVGAMVATGGAAGAKRAKVANALTAAELGAVADQAYSRMKSAGIGVKPSSFDAAVNGIEQELHVAGYRPTLHPKVKVALDELKAAKGVPQSYQELDQMHRVANGVAKSLEPDEKRIGGMLAGKIDDFMENLQPSDLMSQGNPSAAFSALKEGRDAWRRKRGSERVADIIAKSYDISKKNYTAAGHQTALKQQFGLFKWGGRKGQVLTPEYKRLSAGEKKIVDAIIQGGNAMRMIGKFNFRNPLMLTPLATLGYTAGPVAAGLALAVGEAARHFSARGTLAKARQLEETIRGGKVTPGSWGRPPNAVLYGAAAQRSSDQPK